MMGRTKRPSLMSSSLITTALTAANSRHFQAGSGTYACKLTQRTKKKSSASRDSGRQRIDLCAQGRRGGGPLRSSWRNEGSVWRRTRTKSIADIGPIGIFAGQSSRTAKGIVIVGERRGRIGPWKGGSNKIEIKVLQERD